MERSTPAITAHQRSIANAMAGNKEGWLALFAENALVCDPVGVSPHDPEGEGFRGRARLADFWDSMIAPGNLTLVPHKRYPCGDTIVAVAMTAVNLIGELKTSVEMIAVYEVNPQGEIIALKVYWDVQALAEQIGL